MLLLCVCVCVCVQTEPNTGGVSTACRLATFAEGGHVSACVMMPSRYGVVWVYSDIRARMRYARTGRRLTNRTDVTGPAATGIHPNCIRSLRDTASRLPRVDTLRRSSLPKFHDHACRRRSSERASVLHPHTGATTHPHALSMSIRAGGKAERQPEAMRTGVR